MPDGASVTEVKYPGNYTFTFTAVNGSGYTGAQAVSFSVILNAPTNVKQTACTATTATVSWEQTGSVSSWIVEYDTDSSFRYAKTVTSATASAALTIIEKEAACYVRIKAVSGSFESEWSSTATVYTTEKVWLGFGSTGQECFLPTNLNWKYYVSQQIYRANELASADLEGYTPLNAPAAFAECGLANVNYRATQDAGLQLTYVSLVLKSKTTLRLYFKRTEATASDPLPTLTDGTNVYEPHQKDGETTDGEYYYDITDFAPGEIFSMRSVSFDGGEQFNVCVGDYCNWAIASNDTNLADTVTALYSYDEYGKAYKTPGYTPGEG